MGRKARAWRSGQRFRLRRAPPFPPRALRLAAPACRAGASARRRAHQSGIGVPPMSSFLQPRQCAKAALAGPHPASPPAPVGWHLANFPPTCANLCQPADGINGKIFISRQPIMPTSKPWLRRVGLAEVETLAEVTVGSRITFHVSRFTFQRINPPSPQNLTVSLQFPSNILKTHTTGRCRSTTYAKCPRKLSNSWLTLLLQPEPAPQSPQLPPPATGKPCPPAPANPLQRHPQIAFFPRRFCAVFKGGISLLLVPQSLAKSQP